MWSGLLLLPFVACGPNVRTGDEPGVDRPTTSQGSSSTGLTTPTSSASVTTLMPSATAADSTRTGPSDDTTLGESSGFPHSPDWGSLNNDCALGGDKCPKGEKCMPWASDGGDLWDARRCTPIAADPAPVGAACSVQGWPASGIDTCDEGAICWSVNPLTNIGTCTSLCVYAPGDDICVDPDEVCTSGASLEVCVDRCDPLANDCAAGESCYVLEPWHYPERVTVCFRSDTPIAVNSDVFVATCDAGWTGVPTFLTPGAPPTSCAAHRGATPRLLTAQRVGAASRGSHPTRSSRVTTSGSAFRRSRPPEEGNLRMGSVGRDARPCEVQWASANAEPAQSTRSARASTAARPSSHVGTICSGGSTKPLPPVGRNSMVKPSAPPSPYDQSSAVPPAA